MELPEVLRLLRRRWLILLLTVEAALVVGFALVLVATPQYQSTTTLFVANPVTEGSGADTLYADSRFSRERLASYAKLIPGPRVAEAVSDRLGIGGAETLRDQVTARPVPETVLIQVAVTDHDPELARLLSQTFVEEFIELVPELESPLPGGHPEVQVLVAEPAGPPVQTAPRPSRSLSLSLVVGLLAGVALAVVVDQTDRRVGTARQLAALTGEPPLATVEARPSLRRRAGSAGSARERELLRQLAVMLQVGGLSEAPATVLVTPVTPGSDDGLSADLALALAEIGLRVTLVDADARSASASRRLGARQRPGLADALAGAELDGALQERAPGLRVLPPGPLLDRGADRQAVARLLTELQASCDVVLVTGPPLTDSSLSTLLAATVDATLLVVVRGRSLLEQVEQCVHMVARVEGRLAGSVLVTGARVDPPGRSGGRRPREFRTLGSLRRSRWEPVVPASSVPSPRPAPEPHPTAVWRLGAPSRELGETPHD